MSSNSTTEAELSVVTKDEVTTAVAPDVFPFICWETACWPTELSDAWTRRINLLVQLPPEALTIYWFGYSISGVSPSIILKNILCPSDVPFAL